MPKSGASLFPEVLTTQATSLLAQLRKKRVMLATAESCTGGLIAGLFTEIPGSSDVIERGFITYSNEAKSSLLGVPVALIKKYGAVSAEVVGAMATGAIKNSRAQISISVTGIAGPGGGSKEKPVGLVYIGIGVKGKKPLVKKCNFKGNRGAVRMAAVKEALALTMTMT